MQPQNPERDSASILTRGGRLSLRGRNAHWPKEPDQEVLAPLISRVAAGDAIAFNALYDRTVDRVFAVAWCIARDRSDAEDILCDTYERAWCRAHDYARGRGDVMAWLLTLCRSRAIDVVRRRRLRSRVHSSFAHREGDGAVGEATLSSHDFESGHSTCQLLSAMPRLRQQVLALAFCHDLSHQEIATELSLPIGTVKSHLRRAIAVLRSTLGLPGNGAPR